MAQVPMRMAQPGLVPPHQQRPPMMVSMTQPPPVSMQGLVSMAPMIGPGGGMAVMTQAMNHPDSGHDHHTMNGQYHPHHPPPPPPHGGGPRPHGPSQGHHPVPPPPLPNGHSQPPHSAPPHSQYHPHPGAPHHVPHSHHNGPHSVHHSNPHQVPHSHSGAHPPHMTNHSSSSNSSTHNTHGHPVQHLQSGPHLNQPSHSMPHTSPHQMSGMNTGSINSNQHHSQHQPPQHHSQHPHHHSQPMHQQPLQHSQVPPPPPPQPAQQHLHQHQVLNQPPQHQPPHSIDSGSSGGAVIVMNSNGGPNCNNMNMANNHNTAVSNSVGSNAGNIISNRTTSNSLETSCTESTSTFIREKTPMCLINELARYNKISHQYCLTDEKGPAHKKIFTVTLKLGDNEEEYSASGPSIKKAQHLAAATSLEKTKFKHPPPKTQRQNKQTKLTPTVELNALAMKRGEAAVYTFMEAPRPPNPYAYNVPPNLRAVYNQKFYGRPPVYPMFFVTLHVGSKDFVGEGATAQQAKHNAASKALKAIKALPMPENTSSNVQSGTVVGNNTAPASTAPVGGELSELDPNADLKSPISLVHEIALKRNLSVSFEVIRESGPPHMRTFVTTCVVGEIQTQGEGTGKKVSKKRAAELMLEQLRKLPPVSSSTLSRVKRKPTAKKKSRNLIKEQKAAPEYGHGINPISRLIQIQQAKKEKEPIYTLLVERGIPRRREFVMQVTVGSNTAKGSGPNKKLAKRAAAESMLQLLGYSRPQPQPAKPALKMDGSHSDSDKARKQVTFLEETDSSRVSGNDTSYQNSNAQSSIQSQSTPTGSGRQLVPGLIMMPDGSALHGYQQMQQSNMSNVNMNQMVDRQATAAIAKELLESGSSPTAKALTKPHTNNTPATSQAHTPNHHMNTSGTQQPLIHQQSTTVSTSPPSIQPILNHQPMAQTSPKLQSSQTSPQQNQSQLNSIQSLPSSNVNMVVANKNNNNNNTSNNNIGVNTNVNTSNNNTSNTSRNGGLTISGNTTGGQAVRPKDHLMYLANILNLQVQFTDFPKGNKGEFLTLVSLSTTPPHVSHGGGPTIDTSHDQACLTALRNLAEMGLDSVTSGNATKTN